MKINSFIISVLYCFCYTIVCAEDMDSIRTINKQRFMVLLEKDRKAYTKYERPFVVTEYLYKKERIFSEQSYALIFNWLLGYTTEEASEGIGWYLYEIFDLYPEKFQEFDSYLQFLDTKEQKKILNRLTFYLSFQYIFSDNFKDPKEVQVNDFRKKFPYLYQKGCLRVFLDTIDNYL